MSGEFHFAETRDSAGAAIAVPPCASVQVPTTRNGRIVSAPLSFQVVWSTSASGGTARPTGKVLNTATTALSCDQEFGRTGFLSGAGDVTAVRINFCFTAGDYLMSKI